jgi:hypothetical protein
MQDIWYLYTPFVEDQHVSTTSTTTSSTTSSYNAFVKISLGILGWALLISGLFEVGTPTRPPRGRPCQTPCSYARRSWCLYTSLDQDHDLVFLLFFEHQTSHAACINAQGLLYESVFDAFLFTLSYQHVGKPVSDQSLLDLLFLLSLLDQHTSHPAHHNAWILLYECILDAL